MKLVSQEIKQEQEKQEKLASYATEFDLHEHANNDSMAQVNGWLKNAKWVRLNQELDEKKKKTSNNKHEDLHMTDQEKHQIRAYHTYHFEAEKDIPERFDPVDIFKFLSVYKDLKLDALDAFGRNPLHYAACVGAFSCSTLMISKGTDMNVVDSDNVSEWALCYLLLTKPSCTRTMHCSWLCATTISTTLSCCVIWVLLSS